jgi:hypothetical protein
MATLFTSEGKVSSGVPIDYPKLPNLFGPRAVSPFTPPPTGIDNLGITSTDSFFIPGRGEVTVNFTGYVRVARSEPTCADWVNAEVYTNLIEMRMVGKTSEIGDVIVTLNPEYQSAGQLRTPFADLDKVQPEKACRMAVGAMFHAPRLGKCLFNKEPIELTIDNVRAIPPAGNPGIGRIYRNLPLYDVDNPHGPIAAYLTGLSFAMGTYLTEDELGELRREDEAHTDAQGLPDGGSSGSADSLGFSGSRN